MNIANSSFQTECVVLKRFVDVGCLNSRRYFLIKVLYSFDVRWFSNTVSGVNVTWRRIRARSDPESLIYWEVDLDAFVLVAVASRSDADDEGLESLVVVVVAVARYFRSRSIKSPLTKLLGSPIDTGKAFWVVSGSYRWHRNIVDIVGRRRLIFAICACWWEYGLPRYLSFQCKQRLVSHQYMWVHLIWSSWGASSYTLSVT